MRIHICLAFLIAAPLLDAQAPVVNPKIREIVSQVSEQRIEATIRHLESFGTRNTMSSQDDPLHGVGAARKWMLSEIASYNPRLQVRFDHFRVKKNGDRIFRDVDMYNVIAVLPGKLSPERQIVVSGHYDSLNLVPKPASETPDNAASVGERPVQYDWSAVDVSAPGACDDGSGTAAVMELARVMSQYEFDKTLVFIAFVGEEQGLAGATLEAAKARSEKWAIEAVLNNDIIGSEVSGNGRRGNNVVNVFGSEIMDSPSQALARYSRTIGERYLPEMSVDAIFQQDRLGRGGDHTPFQIEGFAAVRFTTPNEDFSHQHNATDTLANMSVPYTARVARVNAAVAASLALAPKPPVVVTEARTGAMKGRLLPLIARGKSQYDAVLRWKNDAPESDLAGYVVVMRPISAPFWEREIFVGNVSEYTVKDVSIDEIRFGVKAVDKDGNESLISSYVFPVRDKFTIETY